MEINRELLVGEIGSYYNSFEEKFKYKIENEEKSKFFFLLFFISFAFLFLNLLPILADNKSYLDFIFPIDISFFEIEVQSNFYSRWIVGVLLALFLSLFFFVILKLYMVKFKRKGIPGSINLFCSLFYIRKNLISYQVNNQSDLLRICIDFSYKIFITIEYAEILNSDNRSIRIVENSDVLTSNISWYKTTEDTKNVLLAIKQFRTKLLDRLKYGEDLDAILNILNLMIIREYFIIKPDSPELKDRDKSEVNEELLKSWASLVNNLPALDRNKDKPDSSRDIFKRIFINVIKLYTQSNVVGYFLIVYFTAIVGISILSYLLSMIFGIAIDSTILSGIIGSTTILAITLTIQHIKKKGGGN